MLKDESLGKYPECISTITILDANTDEVYATYDLDFAKSINQLKVDQEQNRWGLNLSPIKGNNPYFNESALEVDIDIRKISHKQKEFNEALKDKMLKAMSGGNKDHEIAMLKDKLE